MSFLDLQEPVFENWQYLRWLQVLVDFRKALVFIYIQIVNYLSCSFIWIDQFRIHYATFASHM